VTIHVWICRMDAEQCTAAWRIAKGFRDVGKAQWKMSTTNRVGRVDKSETCQIMTIR
jgi:hypothetical protein